MALHGLVPLNEVVGVAGLVLLLAAFALNVTGRIDEESQRYHALNAAGAGLLVYYSYTLDSIPFLVLETVWGGVALYKLLQR